MSGIPKDKSSISKVKLPPSIGKNKNNFILAHYEKPHIPNKIIFGFVDTKKQENLIDIISKALEECNKDDDREVKEIWEEFKISLLKFEREAQGNVVKLNPKELHELMDIFLANVENFSEIMREILKESPLMFTLVQTYMKYEEENFPDKK
jgi:hypothetical protein